MTSGPQAFSRHETYFAVAPKVPVVRFGERARARRAAPSSAAATIADAGHAFLFQDHVKFADSVNAFLAAKP
jgi:pimeloyl-ACP methyl ester carboxylesterase